MSKSITMSARAIKKPDADQWVEMQETSDPPKPTVKPKRLTIDIHPELHTRLKIACAQRGIQIADLVRGLIETDLDAHQPSGKRDLS